MCLLTFMHDGVTPDIDKLTTGAQNNPDGFGFAIHDRTSIVSFSSLNYNEVLDKFLTYRKTHSGPALFHSRITTHGATSVDNCHPFRLGQDPLTVMGHNGMLPIEAKNGRSDTRILAEDLLPSWGGASILNNKKNRKKLSKFASGSKLVFLSANPDVQNDWYIINERDGHWDNGVWWSNSSYKWERYTYSGSGMYTSGWSKTSTTSNVVDYDDSWIEDCSYLDANHREVWAELWTCRTCKERTYVDNYNIDYVDMCTYCDHCFYCNDSRMLCACMYEPQYDLVSESYTNDNDNYVSTYTGSLQVPNYDSTVDYF